MLVGYKLHMNCQTDTLGRKGSHDTPLAKKTHSVAGLTNQSQKSSGHLEQVQMKKLTTCGKPSVTGPSVGTSTICQHCLGNNRGVEAGSIIQS